MSDFTVEGTESPIFVRLGNRGRGYKVRADKSGDDFDRLIPIDTVGRINGIRLSNYTFAMLVLWGALLRDCQVTQ